MYLSWAMWNLNVHSIVRICVLFDKPNNEHIANITVGEITGKVLYLHIYCITHLVKYFSVTHIYKRSIKM